MNTNLNGLPFLTLNLPMTDCDPAVAARAILILAETFDVDLAELAELHAEGDGIDPATISVTSSGTVSANSPAPAVSVQTGDIERDITGTPWDIRIHSGKDYADRKKTEKGVWRARKGVSDQLKAQVTAELRAVAGNAAPQLPTPEPAAVTSPTPTPAAMPGLPPMPGAVQVTPFVEFSDYIAKKVAAGAFTQEYVDQVLVHWGVTSGLASLASNNDFCTSAKQQFVAQFGE